MAAPRKKKAGGRKRKKAWSLTKGTKLYLECKRNMELIEGGRMLCVDPSCGSTGSMPGYALYSAGKLTDSGIIQIDAVGRDLSLRLQDLMKALREDFDVPEILITEKLPARRYGGGSAEGHASLLKSKGVIISAYSEVPVIRIRPQAWHKMTHDGWFKDDEQDAIAMGHCALEVCRRIRDGEIS